MISAFILIRRARFLRGHAGQSFKLCRNSQKHSRLGYCNTAVGIKIESRKHRICRRFKLRRDSQRGSRVGGSQLAVAVRVAEYDSVIVVLRFAFVSKDNEISRTDGTVSRHRFRFFGIDYKDCLAVRIGYKFFNKLIRYRSDVYSRNKSFLLIEL